MVKILVLGATGYIGFPLCQSLRRDSHIVYGLARSNEKAELLAQEEVIPIIGTTEGGEFLEIIRRENIDIVIDSASASSGPYKVLQGLKQIATDRLSHRGPNGAKLGFIYISGTWVHGSSPKPFNDLSPVGLSADPGCPSAPTELIAWRAQQESEVLNTRDVIDSVIMRPSLVWGKQSKLWSLWFKPISEAAASSATSDVNLAADDKARAGLIHVDDVVSAVHLVANKHSMVNTASGNYPVFDISSSSESVKAILEAAAAAAGCHGRLKFNGYGQNKFEAAMNTTQKGDSSRLKHMLGWLPTHLNMEAEIEVCFAAWKAFQ